MAGNTAQGARSARPRPGLWLAGAAACMPALADAHAWSVPYYLPVPLWLYAYAATGALIISFMVLAFAPGHGAPRAAPHPGLCGKGLRIPAWLLHAGQIAGMAFLALLIVAGLAGTPNPFLNLGMPGFWIWFYLGSMYASAAVGGIYAFTNPFAGVLRIAARYFPGLETGRYRYPRRLAAYPALCVYAALIALELFGAGRPRDVGLFLIGYTVYAIAGAFCFGPKRWLRHCDAFGMLCGLCARLSPFHWRLSPGGQVIVGLRNPIAGLARSRPSHTSVVAFLAFMVASTAYDGLRDTAAWNQFFWRGVYPHVASLFPALGKGYALSGQVLLAWQWLAFAAMGAAYYGLFRFFCALEAAASRSPFGGKRFSLQFCFALLPIAFFYNVAHYFTLFLDQGRKTIALASDPLGLGWALFPVPPVQDAAAQPLVNVGAIWHAQVFLILAGHLLSVYATHAIAARSRHLAGTAAISQLPLLVLTIVLTVSGLWILSLPLA